MFSVVMNAPLSSQNHLSTPHMMLPFFTKMNTIYNAIYRVIADVGVDALYQGVKLRG